MSEDAHRDDQRRVPTYCRVCEPSCGLIATVADGRLVKLEPDREHPATRGFACPKGLAGVEIHHDPDRLNAPMRGDRNGGRTAATWDEAVADIAARTRAIVDRWGPRSLATYAGNPAGFNSRVGIGMAPFVRRLGGTRHFYAGTQDCQNKFAASSAVFGSTHIQPIPDIDDSDYILLFGSNWRVSKASFIALPNAYARLMQAAARGARITFVNPRVTETSDERTGPTLQIRPDTDVYFLAALLCEIDRSVGFHRDALEHGARLDDLRAYVRRYPPERVAGVCGVDASAIVAVAREFAAAKRATVHMSTGVNMGRQGTLAYWLVHMLSLVTGNLDAEGGNVVANGLYDVVARGRGRYGDGFVDTEFGRLRSGDLPGGLLADHILDAEDPIRALFVYAGNPLLSIPGQERLEKALRNLELLVVIDIYPNATGELADWLLAATDQFERADVNGLGGMQSVPWAQHTERIVAPQHDRREEWWIFARIAQALGQPSELDGVENEPEEAAEERSWRRIDHMLAGSGITRSELRASPRGLPIPDAIRHGRLLTEMVDTADGRVDCCPPAFAEAIDRNESIFAELEAAAQTPGDLRLISRRDSRMHNTWYQNVEGMRGGKRSTNRLAINPSDAKALGIVDGAAVRVASEWGALDTVAEHDERLRVGVVSMEHGWGPQPGLRRAGTTATGGVNVNALLPSGPGSFEELSNQQWMTGIPVTVVPAASPPPRR